MRNTETSQSPSPPAYSVRSGAVSASVWLTSRIVNGQSREFAQIKVLKSYRDKDGEWHNTPWLDGNDLLDVAEVARRAHARFVVKEQWPAKDDHNKGAGATPNQAK